MQSRQHPDFAAFRMVPAHGDLRDLKAMLLRDVEDFHMEAEGLQPLAAEDDFRRVLVEQFEAALCVGDWQADRDAHYRIENTARTLAKTGLMNADQGSIESPAADRHPD